MADAKQDKLGEINNAVVHQLVMRGILASHDPADRKNDNITRHLADHLQSIVNLRHFGDDGSKETVEKTLDDLTSVINNRKNEANLYRDLGDNTRQDITEAVVAGWKQVVHDPRNPRQHFTNYKQDKLGEINNAVVNELKSKNILVSSDPADRSNDNITRHLAEYLQAIVNAKHFGDDGSKNTEEKTLNDLTSIINNRRTDALFWEKVTKEQIIEAAVTGWNKVVQPQQGQQPLAASQQAAGWKDRVTAGQESNLVGATR